MPGLRRWQQAPHPSCRTVARPFHKRTGCQLGRLSHIQCDKDLGSSALMLIFIIFREGWDWPEEMAGQYADAAAAEESAPPSVIPHLYTHISNKIIWRPRARAIPWTEHFFTVRTVSIQQRVNVMELEEPFCFIKSWWWAADMEAQSAVFKGPQTNTVAMLLAQGCCWRTGIAKR